MHVTETAVGRVDRKVLAKLWLNTLSLPCYFPAVISKKRTYVFMRKGLLYFFIALLVRLPLGELI